MEAFPAFFPLAGARVVIAGVGEPAEARARLFAGSPAEIVRLDEIWGLDPDAYQGAKLIFIASHDDGFARQAEVAARTAGAPVNVYDRPQLSDFNTPAIIDRGAVVAAVGTSGAAPLLAQVLRAELETRLPAGVGETADLLGGKRDRIRAAFPDLAERRSFLRAVLSGSPPTAETLDAALSSRRPPDGRISLIDLPAADDLLSLRAIHALGEAEAVAAPPVAESLVARHARRDAVRLDFETLAPELLLDLIRHGRSAVVIAPPTGLAEALAGEPVERLRAAPEGG
ncbi:MAG TPA: bifunctional precorrin-2 dehydrogenase/sirohydrochlorin ferrochelatase [Caulobacteraceae bacterium]|jgi:precorrin-2 dehydrogenase/sirohydrochlorin ferrochelatase|nr:bifunctional precorrin-2 dehydrogenase/sirohydrochlorin ferrochelatase [Caulobacteraceae bacterium]